MFFSFRSSLFFVFLSRRSVLRVSRVFVVSVTTQNNIKQKINKNGGR
jgi:hypothetical protein